MEPNKNNKKKRSGEFLTFDPQEYFGKTLETKLEELEQEQEEAENIRIGKAIVNEILKLCFVPLIIWPCWNFVMVGLFGLPSIGFFKSIAIYLLVKVLKS